VAKQRLKWRSLMRVAGEALECSMIEGEEGS